MAYTYRKMSLNYASLLHTCFRHRLHSPTVARLDRRLDDDLITSARRADVSLPARPTHACTCYCKFPGNQGRGQPAWSRAAATVWSTNRKWYVAYWTCDFEGYLSYLKPFFTRHIRRCCQYTMLTRSQVLRVFNLDHRNEWSTILAWSHDF